MFTEVSGCGCDQHVDRGDVSRSALFAFRLHAAAAAAAAAPQLTTVCPSVVRDTVLIIIDVGRSYERTARIVWTGAELLDLADVREEADRDRQAGGG